MELIAQNEYPGLESLPSTRLMLLFTLEKTGIWCGLESGYPAFRSPVMGEERMRPGRWLWLCFVHCFDTVGWWQEEHPACSSHVPLVREGYVLFQSKCGKKLRGTWLIQILLENAQCGSRGC